MANSPISTKHLQISKANTMVTITLTIAAFVTVFCLLAAKTLLDQRSYNAKVISEKELAVKTLKENIEAVDKLVISYKEFVGRPENLIKGQSTGTGDKDGDNAKIILDALPGSYDFPALTASLEKVLTEKGLNITVITGVDDEVVQAAKNSETPEVVEMPFTFTVSGSYDAVHDLIQTLEHSIRPMQITKLNFSAGEGGVILTVDGKTYYQSGKKFNITTKVVQ